MRTSPLRHCDRPLMTVRNKRLTAWPCGAGMALPLHLAFFSGSFQDSCSQVTFVVSTETTPSNTPPFSKPYCVGSFSLLPLGFCRFKKQI